jgi:2-hydroxycyclohexanecarboxyl-CoA dehydrogenase
MKEDEMSKELSGKTAFVTGSGRGIGRAIAERLAELGANVAIHDLEWTAPAKYNEAADLGVVAKAMERFGTKTTAVTGNIGDRAAVQKMARDIEDKIGPVNVLVNCAGGDIGAAGGKPNPNNALDISLEDIQVLTNNNLIGTMLVCQTFVSKMRDRKEGSVINIASAAAHMGCSPEVVYSTLKAAVVHYTRCLALEMRPFGVRINAVSPGQTRTARFVATRKTDPGMMETNASLLRYADPSEIADAVAFLAGPRSKFMHGQVLRVDGGSTLFPG